MEYNHLWTCEELDKDDYVLESNSQDVEFWLDFVAFPKRYRKDITAVIVIIGDGDLLAMWLSESGRYYDLSARYRPLPYYRPVRWPKKNLPEYWLESNELYHK